MDWPPWGAWGRRQAVALGLGVNRPEAQGIHQAHCQQHHKHQRRNLEPVEDKIPPGPALCLPCGTPAGLFGLAGPGNAGNSGSHQP